MLLLIAIHMLVEREFSWEKETGLLRYSKPLYFEFTTFGLNE